jgi:RHS repeat-associated protein
MIALAQHGGQVWFDRIGTGGTACVEATEPPPTIPEGDTVWVEDSLPAGVSLSGSMSWDTSQHASGSASLVHSYEGSAVQGSSITALNEAILTGESGVVYLRVNECALPREIKITWYATDGYWKSVFWGEQLLGGEGVSRGAVPIDGDWVRLEIPFAELGLEGKTVGTIALAQHSGQVWFDRIGKVSPIAPAVLTGFTASHASPQPAGTAIIWIATASGTVMPLDYQFERQDGGVWSVVQAYGPANSYTWTPGASDVGEHAVRVSVRNGGSLSPFDDTETLAMTITGSGGLLHRPPSDLAAFLSRVRHALWSRHARPPISMAVSGRPLVQSSTAVNHFLYTPELNLMVEATAANGTSSIGYEYLWFGGQPVAQIEAQSGAIHYYFNDQIGAPILTTSSTGAIDWRVEREPYGRIVELRAGVNRHQPLSLPGQEEASTDVRYNIFRWYRSSWGRYTQADPIGLNGGSNLYVYVSGQPNTQTDPFGLFSIPRDRNYNKCRTLRRGYAEKELERVRREPRCRDFFRGRCNTDLDRLFDDPLPHVKLVSERKRSSGGAFDSRDPDAIYISMRECKAMEDFAHTLIHELGHYGDYHNSNDSISNADHSDGCGAEIACFGFTRSLNCKDRGFRPYRPPKR